MAERLTKKINKTMQDKYSLGSYLYYDFAGLDDTNKLLNKLGKLEDILEKYGVESIEELNERLEDVEQYNYETNHQFIDVMAKYGIESIEELDKKLDDRDTWKRACELASSHISWCPAKQGECNCSKEKRDCTNFFYQQAKKGAKQ